MFLAILAHCMYDSIKNLDWVGIAMGVALLVFIVVAILVFAYIYRMG